MRDSEDKIQFITDDIENIPVLEEGEPFMIKGGNKLYIGNGVENVEISGGTDITVNSVPPDAAGNIQNTKPSETPSMWTLIGNPGEEYPQWIQPIGVHDAYPAGARVTHNELRWVSDVDNIWEPGNFGWMQVD